MKIGTSAVALFAVMLVSETANAAVCSEPGPESPAVAVLNARAEGIDVVVTLVRDRERKLPAVVHVVVEDAGCDEVASGRVHFLGADEIVEVTIPGALSEVPARGTRYEVTLRGGAGRLAVPYGYQVGLEDAGGGLFVYTLLGNLTTDAVFLTDELRQVLNEVEQDGALDVLDEVVGRSPDLAGAVAVYASELAALLRQRSLEDCHCFWTAVVRFTPRQERVLLGSASEPLTGYEGPGAGHAVAAGIHGGAIHHEPTGETVLALALRCVSIRDWVDSELPVGPGSLKTERPVYQACAAGCGGTVLHEVDFGLRLLAEAEGGTTGPASAEASELVEYEVDGTPVFSSRPEVVVFASPVTFRSDSGGFSKAAVTPATAPSAAQLRTAGWLDVQAEAGADALAVVRNSYAMRGEAEAACAARPRVTVTVRDVVDDVCPKDGDPSVVARAKRHAGLAIDRWCR